MNLNMKKSLIVAAALLLAVPSFAAEKTFVADPAKTTVEFTLGDILHTVHGVFRLKSGVIRFNDATGSAGGELVVDAASGDSGSNARDKKMKRDILEAQKYPDIVFRPQQVKGFTMREGHEQVELDGIFTLHGQDHPMSLEIPLDVNGPNATADIHFLVPYVKWGLKDPSTFILRVSKTVEIVVHAAGQFTAVSARR